MEKKQRNLNAAAKAKKEAEAKKKAEEEAKKKAEAAAAKKEAEETASEQGSQLAQSLLMETVPLASPTFSNASPSSSTVPSLVVTFKEDASDKELAVACVIFNVVLPPDAGSVWPSVVKLISTLRPTLSGVPLPAPSVGFSIWVPEEL